MNHATAAAEVAVAEVAVAEVAVAGAAEAPLLEVDQLVVHYHTRARARSCAPTRSSMPSTG